MTIIQRPGTLVYICECDEKENAICSSNNSNSNNDSERNDYIRINNNISIVIVPAIAKVTKTVL